MTSKPSKNAGRLIAMGDIHGHVLALRGLFELIAPQPNDVIVTLGDYINRGPDSYGVIEALLELGQMCQLISILGNHDEVMLDSRTDPHAAGRWRYQGGTESLESYGPNDSTNDVSESHWSFLEGCRPYYETLRPRLMALFTSIQCRRGLPASFGWKSCIHWPTLDEPGQGNWFRCQYAFPCCSSHLAGCAEYMTSDRQTHLTSEASHNLEATRKKAGMQGRESS
jgi:serine/threonine protein phosphatase 1